ncbi:MAG: CotH kinase family protein [Planctomycetota bacterium]|jgi:hypothetical protein
MQIKSHQKKPYFYSLMPKRKSYKIGFILLTFCLVFFALFYAGYKFKQEGHSLLYLRQFIMNSLDNFKIDNFKKVFTAIIRANPEHIYIDIKHKDFMKLAYQREVALAKFFLISGNDDFVPATVRHNDKSVNVRLRLKGDFSDHLQGSKWSFRIKVNGDSTLFGMKLFSIQHPKTRNYINEWIYHQALKREGVLSLRYHFINVTLNGKDLGIYALEEHFEKRLIEHNELREGPIVRFNEELRWAVRSHLRPHFPKEDPNGNSLFLTVDIDTFQTNRMLADFSGYAQHVKAIHLLESFRRGKLKTSDVFDIQKLARFFAINDIVGAQHSAFWGNIRFYYNPITSRLEPIGFDGDGGRLIKALSISRTDSGPIFFKNIFNDPLFLEAYVKTLERISEPSYLDNLLNELNDDLERNLNIIFSEFSSFDFSKEIFYRNQRYIRAVLNPIKGLHAYYHQVNGKQIELELGNIQSMPVEVINVVYQNSVPFQPRQKIILREQPPIQLEPVDYQITSFTLPDNFVWSAAMIKDLTLHYKLVGASRTRQVDVFPWSYLDIDFFDTDLIRQDSNIHEFDFLQLDESSHNILIKPGNWIIDRSLIIPKGHKVIAGEGTKISLSNSAKILSYSPLEFIGSEAHPIVIQSRDRTGQGIIVMNTDQASILDYVTFYNLANPVQGGWELTGAVTFYESPVHISDSQFLGNRSEDALNIVRSEFSIDKTLFRDVSSDAFDADFSKGKITNSHFIKVGNDAIDASGSVLEIENVQLDGIGDKGLSSGEKSRIVATDIDIQNAHIAIATKDRSKTTVKKINISNSSIGLTVYQKKQEFGPATMHVNILQMRSVNTPYLLEEQSELTVADKTIAAKQKNVYQILYGPEKSKTAQIN